MKSKSLIEAKSFARAMTGQITNVFVLNGIFYMVVVTQYMHHQNLKSYSAVYF